jgi:hypothetical protein
MIADLEFQPGLVVYHQRGFGVDLGNVNAFSVLFGDVDET